MKRLKWFGAVAVAAVGCVALADEAWPESLWLGRGGFWTKRLALTAVNPSAEALEGRPVSIRVGSGTGELPLVGVRMEELRLVDAKGVELLYGVCTADGAPLESGPVPAGAKAQAAAALLKDFAALVTIPNAGGRYSTRILPEPEQIGRLRRRAGELLDGTACSWERP